MASRGSKRKTGVAQEVEETGNDIRDAGDKSPDKRRKKSLPSQEDQAKSSRKRSLENVEDGPSKQAEPEKYFPIAIVGIGIRFPEARNAEEFIQVLEEGREVYKEIPADRWDVSKYHHPDQKNIGTHISRKGGFMESAWEFDHSFYNISPREASNMDPQHRHLLETSQEALDDAGIPSEKLPKNTGSFVGVCTMDHGLNVIDNPLCMNPYTHTGVAHSICANRISYAYDLRGPSIVYDSAEASGLTAMHYACYALWNKECPLGIVVGVNQMTVPEPMIAYSQMGVLSPDDHTRPFSKDANGHVRCEGTGVVIVKPLHEALKDRNHVYCVIKASALAYSGATPEITVSDVDVQTDLLKKTYNIFGLSMDQVDFVEAHAAGHPEEDVREVQAIARAFTSEGRRRHKPLSIGSSKGNFGYMEGAAGLMQIIKSALMIENRTIYPNINLGELHPDIKLGEWNLDIPLSIEQFKERKPFTVATSTAGSSGSLGHMVFEEYKQKSKPHKKGNAGWTFGPSAKKGLKIPIPLSAKSAQALRNTCQKWSEFESDADAHEVVGWLSTRRSHYSNRLVIFADSGEDFRKKKKVPTATLR